MGREVRRVPKDWQHPTNRYGNFKPLFDGCTFENRLSDWTEYAKAHGSIAANDYHGSEPDPDDYMPVWTDAEADHLMMYEDTTEGTPISPAFKTPEELARWLADNNASAFGDCTATYKQWLATIRRGSAVSVVISGGVMTSGVAALSSEDDT